MEHQTYKWNIKTINGTSNHPTSLPVPSLFKNSEENLFLTPSRCCNHAQPFIQVIEQLCNYEVHFIILCNEVMTYKPWKIISIFHFESYYFHRNCSFVSFNGIIQYKFVTQSIKPHRPLTPPILPLFFIFLDLAGDSKPTGFYPQQVLTLHGTSNLTQNIQKK